MKPKHFLTSIIILFALLVNAQQTQQWPDILENYSTKELQLDKKNSKDAYLNYDFSTLMVPRTEFLGFIGTDYRRIKVYFLSIVKDESNPDIYHIKGATIVKDNKCDFEGTVKVKSIREYLKGQRTIENRFKSKNIMNQGVLIGEYLFKENPNQKHVGTFEGIMTLSWYIDEFDILYYDDLELMADGYSNNQYVGTWTMYNTQKGKPCNWGEYRIPMSGDLDIGAGEFAPNPKYNNEGWK